MDNPKYVRALVTIGILIVLLSGILGAGSLAADVAQAQPNPTEQQATINAIVAQYFIQTAEAQQMVGATRTIEAAFNQALTATAEYQATFDASAWTATRTPLPTFTVTPSPVPTLAPTYTFSPTLTTVPMHHCPNTPASIMSIGIRGRVTFTDGTPTSLRAQATTSSDRLMRMPEGYEFNIIGGPVCADGYNFWQLETDDGVVGWAAEGNSQSYWIEPAPTQRNLESPLTPVQVAASQEYDVVFTRDDAVWLYSPATHQYTEFLTMDQLPFVSEEGSLRCALFSPDSKYLAFMHFRIHHDGGWQLVIVDSATKEVVYTLHKIEPRFSWSPTQNSLIFERLPHDDYFSSTEFDGGDSGIWTLNMDTLETERQISPFVDPDIRGHENKPIWVFPVVPRWSPDGSRLAFRYALYATEVGHNLQFANIDDDETLLAQDSRYSPFDSAKYYDWSPDSSRVIFEHRGRIFTANLDGTNQQWVIGDSRNPVTYPNWSPDGRYIAYGSAETSNYDGTYDPINIHLLDLHSDTIFDLSDRYLASTWSPDNTRLIGFSGNEIAIIPIDGSDPIIIGEGNCANWITPTRLETSPQTTMEKALDLIGANNLEMMGATGEGQIIAVIDIGIETSHPSLSGRILEEACFSNFGMTSTCGDNRTEAFGIGSGVPSLCFGSSSHACDHGTRVAGIAVGDDGNWRGVAPDARIISIKASWQTIGQQTKMYLNGVLHALEWLEKHDRSSDIAAVIISLQDEDIGDEAYCTYSRLQPIRNAIEESIERLTNKGIAVVVASGNILPTNAAREQTQGIAFPACLENTISVGASQVDDDEVAQDFSMSAPILDLLAPGDNTFDDKDDGIYSPTLLGEYNTAAGTSFAAPFVAGAFAAIRSRLPNESVDNILEALYCSGKPLFDDRNGLTVPRIRIDTTLGVLIGEFIVPAGDAEALDFAYAAIERGCGGGNLTVNDITIID